MMKARRVLVIVAALLVMVVTASLGRWQLARVVEKRDQQAALEARALQPVLAGVTLAEALPPDQLAGLVYRRIELRGRWLSQHTVHLDNRGMDGQVGFYVLTPLQLEASDAVVLVQRGWAPRDFQDRMALPAVETPDGVVTLEGRIIDRPSVTYALGDEVPGPIRQNLDLHAFAEETGLPLAEMLVEQTGEASEGLERHWPPPATAVERNYGYALQWFGLCALFAVLLLWFQVVQPLRSSRHDPDRD